MDGVTEVVSGGTLVMDGDILVTGDLDGVIPDIGAQVTDTGEVAMATITTPITMEEEDLPLIMEEEIILLTEPTAPEETIALEEITLQTETTQPTEVTQADKTAIQTTDEILL